ncbi:hypothetical protein HDE_07576 [Halotydeus destructor]|nr:hypothetical protein HDE_07576 [Halotydeus destructor]
MHAKLSAIFLTTVAAAIFLAVVSDARPFSVSINPEHESYRSDICEALCRLNRGGPGCSVTTTPYCPRPLGTTARTAKCQPTT